VSARAGFGAGLTLCVVVALWWLPSTRLALLDPGGDPVALAARAALALWLCRALAIALFGVRAGAVAGARAGAWATTPLAYVAWPLVALLAVAAVLPWPALLGLELLLLLFALALPMLGAALSRAVPAGSVALLASLVGVLCAGAGWWAHRHGWPTWPVPAIGG
jgi:hypothetical protein